MPKKVKVSGPATPEDIAAAYQKCTRPQDFTRLVALEMAQQGEWTLREIGKALGKQRSTIARWLREYRRGGLESLLKRGHGGRGARLNENDIEALKAELFLLLFQNSLSPFSKGGRGDFYRNWLEKQQDTQERHVQNRQGEWKVARQAGNPPDVVGRLLLAQESEGQK